MINLKWKDASLEEMIAGADVEQLRVVVTEILYRVPIVFLPEHNVEFLKKLVQSRLTIEFAKEQYKNG